MNQITREFPAWPTLDDVLKKVQAGPASPRKRDTLSAFEGLKNRFKVDLTATPATWPVLRRLFSSKSAAQVGMAEKRYANIRSYVFRATGEYGVASPNLAGGPPLSLAWEALLSSVPSKNYRASLARFARHCSARQISPASVGPEALLSFYEALQKEGAVKDPKIILRHVTSYWNYYEKRIEAWPRIRLKTPFPSNAYKFRISDLPESLQEEIQAWEKSRSGGNRLSRHKKNSKSRQKTVSHQKEQILRYVGLLVKSGLAEIDALISFRTLVEPALVEEFLRVLDKMGRSPGYMHGYAYVLLAIAKHYTDLPSEQIEELSNLSSNLRDEIDSGMTLKNRDLLRQFNNQNNVDKLFGFPEAERSRGRKEPNPYRQAKFFERALVVELLLVTLLRIKNVSLLRLDRNMRKCGRCYILTFVGDEMKNGHGHEIEIPEDLTEQLDEFITRHRPQLTGASGPYLFPGKLDGARHSSAIRMEITKAIRKRCGLIMNPHLFRHFGAKRRLDRDPSMLYVVSRQLGHRRIETTQEYYLENDSLSASRMLNRSMDQRK